MTTHRAMSLLMIASSTMLLLATELDKFPPQLHPWIVGAAAVLLALSQSVSKVIKGDS